MVRVRVKVLKKNPSICNNSNTHSTPRSACTLHKGKISPKQGLANMTGRGVNHFLFTGEGFEYFCHLIGLCEGFLTAVSYIIESTGKKN